MTVLSLLGLCLGQVPSIQVLRVDLGRVLWLRGSSAVGVGGALRQSGFHSPGKTEASVCASADLIVNQPPHPAWSF